MTLSDLNSAVRSSWNRETSADPHWTEKIPSLGQCAVTALVVQDLLGGELIRAEVGKASHYWNRLPDGTELDLTRDQFDVFDPVKPAVRAREYVLSFPSTSERYLHLRGRVTERLDVLGAQATSEFANADYEVH